jgi:AraC-like DNA-binding protein
MNVPFHSNWFAPNLLSIVRGSMQTSVQDKDTGEPRYFGTPFLSRLNAIIDRCHSDPSFDVSSLCQKLCLCPMQVHRKMKDQTGLSPGKYLLLYRLSIAFKMILSTELSIGEIASRTGFASQNNFTRAFKREMGANPSQMRRAIHKKVIYGLKNVSY